MEIGIIEQNMRRSLGVKEYMSIRIQWELLVIR
jgi:hypothetical protein